MKSHVYSHGRLSLRAGFRTDDRQGYCKPVLLCLVSLGLLMLPEPGKAQAQDRVNWAGTYAGAEIGPGQTVTDVKSAGRKKEIDRMDAAFGVFAGHNWQFSRLVAGVEASGTYLGGEGKADHPVLGPVRARAAWTASVKGRVGMPFGRVMPYLSAGLALSGHELKARGQSKTSTGLGLVLGAGSEYAASQHLRLRADYSLTGVMDAKDTYGGTSASRMSGNHRLMFGAAYVF